MNSFFPLFFFWVMEGPPFLFIRNPMRCILVCVMRSPFSYFAQTSAFFFLRVPSPWGPNREGGMGGVKLSSDHKAVLPPFFSSAGSAPPLRNTLFSEMVKPFFFFFFPSDRPYLASFLFSFSPFFGWLCTGPASQYSQLFFF